MFCKNCGKELLEGTRFCSACGEPVMVEADLVNEEPIIDVVFDEQPEDTFKAIYICGVISKGYSAKKNYPHNVHLAIVPKKGARCLYQFEEWTIEIEDGMISMIPEIEELPAKYQDLPEQYVTCRIFRWAIGYFFSDEDEKKSINSL